MILLKRIKGIEFVVKNKHECPFSCPAGVGGIIKFFVRGKQERDY
jgi:hypothetical protein